MSWYGDKISGSAFRRYAEDVDAAIDSCAGGSDARKLSGLYELIERESDGLVADAALEQASYIAQGMYIRSAQAQDAAADAFCKDALGLKPAPARRVGFDASDLMRRACDAAEAAGDGARAEAFARAVADGVASSCIGIANDRMAANVKHSGRAEYVRYAYVPTSGKVCGFCCMVASRDFAYKNPKRPSLHAGCRCLIVPGLRGRTVLGGYDPDAYYRGFLQLAKRDPRGFVARDDDGMVLFRNGLVFDVVAQAVAKKGEAAGSAGASFGGRIVSVYAKDGSRVEIRIRQLSRSNGGSVDYTSNARENFGILKDENPDDPYAESNFAKKGTEWRDLFAHHALEEHGFNVSMRPPKAVGHDGRQLEGVTNVDIDINGEMWEVKSPTEFGGRTIENQLRKAVTRNFRNPYDEATMSGLGDGVPPRVVLNLKYVDTGGANVEAEIARRIVEAGVDSVLLVDADGNVTEIKK